jgi:tRNA(Ile)-lysidine synthase
MLQSRLVDYIRMHQMATDQDKILVGVSGGIDSMVLLHLLTHAGFSVGVAHCNFSLRGEESDADEQFVRYHCLMNGIPVHSIKFDTLEYANENGLSIQVAARELRYAYFDEICKEHKYTRIAIAHNLNDSVETVLINLTRGTGLKGLSGIKPINGNIIRPLLFATRNQIEEYATLHKISYREDSSNATIKYKRNFIRHKVMPLLRELNPSADISIYQTSQHLYEAQLLVERQLLHIRKEIVHEDRGVVYLDIQKLKSEPAANLFLVDILSDFNYTPAMAGEVYGLLESSTGSKVESDTHVVFRDRNQLIIQPKQIFQPHLVQVDANTRHIDHPIKLNITLNDYSKGFPLEKDPKVANLDFAKIEFPLSIRPWQPGDRFIPFGMTGFKKISDFLVDIKLPLADKGKVFVLTSANEIVWVIGHRIDNRFRVDDETQKVLRFELED